MKDRGMETTYEGVPQGGVISPLLANIYLHYFDEVMEECGLRLVRYCDDFVIFTKYKSQERKVLQVTREILEGRLGFLLHP